MSQIIRKKRQNQIDQSCLWLTEAFQHLLSEHDFHDITVAQIVRKAGVSRQTFYRHFKNKEELVLWRLEQTFKEYVEKLKAISQYSLRTDLILVFEMIQRDADFLKQIFNAGLEYLVLQKLTSYSYDMESVYEFSSERALRYVSDYFAGGIFMIILRWVQDDMPESVEELADLVINRCFTNDYDIMERKPL